jgi:hypothetical protein
VIIPKTRTGRRTADPERQIGVSIRETRSNGTDSAHRHRDSALDGDA